MQVSGVGDRPLVDSGGFPVVWVGADNCPIGQDPNQGGTNCYGPGDVLYDADNGTAYQIGGDWAIYTLGNQPSSTSAPSAPAASLSNTIYYVDSGEIIEKDTYSDGSATYTDTGMQSPLADGTASSNAGDLQQTTPSPGNPGGFNTPNPVGGYGPYATPDPPVLTDLGTYVQNGELFDHQVDQYGHDYYQDLGPAPPSSPGAGAPAGTPPPAVPSVRTTPPQLGAGTPPQTTTAAPPPAEPVAADGQRLSGQSGVTQAAYKALYGANAAAVWAQQHNAAIGKGSTRPTVPTSPTSTTSRPPTVTHPGMGPTITTPGHPGTTPAISTTGNPTQFGHQVVTWLSKASFIAGVPNAMLVAAGYVGYSMLRNRRRRF